MPTSSSRRSPSLPAWPVRVLSADEEGRLAYQGAVAAAASLPETVAVCDVGGGSTELVVGTPTGGPTWWRSIDLGCVRLTERFLVDDPPGKVAMARAADGSRAPPRGSNPADAAGCACDRGHRARTSQGGGRGVGAGRARAGVAPNREALVPRACEGKRPRPDSGQDASGRCALSWRQCSAGSVFHSSSRARACAKGLRSSCLQSSAPPSLRAGGGTGPARSPRRSSPRFAPHPS